MVALASVGAVRLIRMPSGGALICCLQRSTIVQLERTSSITSTPSIPLIARRSRIRRAVRSGSTRARELAARARGRSGLIAKRPLLSICPDEDPQTLIDAKRACDRAGRRGARSTRSAISFRRSRSAARHRRLGRGARAFARRSSPLAQVPRRIRRGSRPVAGARDTSSSSSPPRRSIRCAPAPLNRWPYLGDELADPRRLRRTCARRSTTTPSRAGRARLEEVQKALGEWPSWRASIAALKMAPSRPTTPDGKNHELVRI